MFSAGNLFAAIGHRGNKVLLVVPSLQIVTAARGNWGDVRIENTKLLAEAVVDKPKSGSLPAAEE